MRSLLTEEHGQYDVRESYRRGVFVDEFGIENPHVKITGKEKKMSPENDYKAPFTKDEAIAFIRHTLHDEQQADPFHHFWSGKDFLDAIKVIVGM